MDYLQPAWIEALKAPVLRVLGALALIVAVAFAARAASWLVRRFANRANLGERLQVPDLSATLGGLAAGLVWLLALPALVAAIGMDDLLVPIQALLAKLFGFLPNLLGAVIVLAIGVLIARIASSLVGGALRAAGSEKLAERMGLGTAFGQRGLAGAVGGLVFVLILLPTLVAALQPLQLDALTQPLSRLLDSMMGVIPKLLASAVVVAVAVVVGRALAGLATGLLASVGFDALPQRLGLRGLGGPGRRSASELMGQVVMFAVVFLAIVQACQMIGFEVLSEATAQLGAALVRIASGLALLAVGLWLATLAAAAVEASRLRPARRLALVVRCAVLFFFAALALRQMGLPSEIVTLAFGAVAFALAMAFALAAGLGGREVAGKLLQRAADAFDDERDPAAPGPK